MTNDKKYCRSGKAERFHDPQDTQRCQRAETEPAERGEPK